MENIARFQCPHCLETTTFRPKVHEALFGPIAFSPAYLSYEVACRYCRRAFLFAVRRLPALATLAPEALDCETKGLP